MRSDVATIAQAISQSKSEQKKGKNEPKAAVKTTTTTMKTTSSNDEWKMHRNMKQRMRNMLDIDERHCAYSYTVRFQLSDVPKNDDFTWRWWWWGRKRRCAFSMDHSIAFKGLPFIAKSWFLRLIEYENSRNGGHVFCLFAWLLSKVIFWLKFQHVCRRHNFFSFQRRNSLDLL